LNIEFPLKYLPDHPASLAGFSANQLVITKDK